MLITIHYKTKFAFKHGVSQSKLCFYAIKIICMCLNFYQRPGRIKDVVTCNNEKYREIRYNLRCFDNLPNDYMMHMYHPSFKKIEGLNLCVLNLL